MRHLAAWSSQLVLALWLVWFGLVLGSVGLRIQREVHRQISAASPQGLESIPESLPAKTNPAASEPALQRGRLKSLPEQHTDFVYSVTPTTTGSLKAIIVLCGPPGLLTLLWLEARRRHPQVPDQG